MFDWLLELFGTVLRFFNDLTHSYLIATLLFAIASKILLFPLSIKQQKNSVKQASLRPKEVAIRKKYKGNTDPVVQRKMQEEITELYQKEGYNPMGGCLPLLIQFPLIIALYNVIRNPLRYICGVGKEGVAKILEIVRTYEGFEKATEINLVPVLNGEYGAEILEKAGKALGKAVEFTHELPDFNFFGLDLSVTPAFDKPLYLLIPLLTGLIAYFSGKLTKKLSYQPPMADGTDSAMRTSNLIMELSLPAMSVWLTFMFPSLLGIYWIFQNILGVLQQLVLKWMFPYPKFTEEDYKNAEREMSGKKYKKNSSRPAPAPGVYRSLHRIDEDEVYEIPDKNKKSASEAPKLKEDNPDHRKKS
ncbi:MAG: YidC/Oxa1 family membrane protein insertase [Ruminococcaceae bacterium]|nr:YidC/Oxa1 family membrane protein insertase [Oscillospiraceae bacterium]